MYVGTVSIDPIAMVVVLSVSDCPKDEITLLIWDNITFVECQTRRLQFSYFLNENLTH